jgi:hypothetical protein
VIQQVGDNGTAITLDAAALILAGGAIWAVSIWSNTQLKMIQAPAEAIQQGVELAAAGLPGSGADPAAGAGDQLGAGG